MNSSLTNAPGPDAMGFKCIQQAYLSSSEPFNSFYKAALKQEYHPTWWQEGTIAVIHKPNKLDYTIPTAYRPLSLLNCLRKVSEKIVVAHLPSMSEKHHLLHR